MARYKRPAVILPPPTLAFLEPGDAVAYEHRTDDTRYGEVVEVGGVLHLYDEDRGRSVPAARVRLLRVWRGCDEQGEPKLVASIQDAGSPNGRRGRAWENNAKLHRLRAKYGLT